MLKELLHHKGLSLYKLSEVSGIPYSTLNDIVNYKVDIANIRAGILFKLADILGLSMDELYELCNKKITVTSETYAVNGSVNIRNKQYILEFQYHNKTYTEELCPVKKEATLFIDSIAKWQMEKIIQEQEMEEMYELCLKAQG